MNNEFDNVNQVNSNSPPPQQQYAPPQYYTQQYQYPPQYYAQQYPPQQYYVQQYPVPQYAVTYIPYGLTPETYEERKKIRRIANIIGGSLLIMLGLAEIIITVVMLLLGRTEFLSSQNYEIFNSPAFRQYLQIILSVTMFTLPFIFLFKVCGVKISPLISFKKPKRKEFLPYYLLGVGVCYFANYCVNYSSQFFKDIGIKYEVNYGDRPNDIFGFMLTFIAVAIVPALVEEFACRGFILGSLRKYGDGFAVVVSAILFGLMHGNFQQIPFAFVVGMILGFITVKTESIWVAIAVHFTNNAVSVLIDFLSSTFDGEIINVFAAIVLTALMFCVTLGLWLLKDNNKAYSFKKVEIKSTTKQIYKWFFTSPTIIIFMVLMVLESMVFFI